MILYVGSYTGIPSKEGRGIFCYDFNQQDGTLSLLHVTEAIDPSYLSVSPKNNLLFAVEELKVEDQPKLSCYRIDTTTQRLQLLSQEKIPGGFPCHTEISPLVDCVIVSCYQTGNVVVYPFDNQGLKPFLANVQHQGASVNEERQAGPHAHMAGCDPSSDGVLVCDLGLDKVMHYRLGEDFKPDQFQSSVQSPPGGGPRHLVFHPNNRYVFVFNEMTADVSVFRYQNRKLTYLDSSDSLPPDFDGFRSGAALRISPDGNFVYASNRGHNSIAVLRFIEESETLELIGNKSTGGKEPRDFTLDPSGRWLLVANQESDTLVVFERDPETGLLEEISRDSQSKTPVCLQWAK